MKGFGPSQAEICSGGDLHFPASFTEVAFGKGPRGFDVGGIIHKTRRLERRVGDVPAARYISRGRAHRKC